MSLKRFIFSLVAVLGFVHSTPVAASDNGQPDMVIVEKNVDAFPGAIYAAPNVFNKTTFEMPPVWYRNPIKWMRLKWAWFQGRRRARRDQSRTV